jgi:hypothetical protein
MSDVWAELNERQRAYLRTLYECDQATEAGRREQAARGHWDRTPASVWRWQMYGPADSALYMRLHAAGLVDPGTGSTWTALENRKLVQCRHVPNTFGVQLLEVQITPLGRKVVRAATGEQRPKPPPKGQLRERQWAALARLYAAGDAGELSEDMMYGRGGFDWMRTLLRLRDYKPSPLMEEYRAPESRMRLTPFGATTISVNGHAIKRCIPTLMLRSHPRRYQPIDKEFTRDLNCSESPRPQNGNSEEVT